MLKKALVCMMICSVLCAILGTKVADAATTWYTCSVQAVGPSGASSYIKLTDTNGAFTNKWFVVSTTNTNSLLASALTAISAQKTVYAGVSSLTNGELQGLYIYP